MSGAFASNPGALCSVPPAEDKLSLRPLPSEIEEGFAAAFDGKRALEQLGGKDAPLTKEALRDIFLRLRAFLGDNGETAALAIKDPKSTSDIRTQANAVVYSSGGNRLTLLYDDVTDGEKAHSEKDLRRARVHAITLRRPLLTAPHLFFGLRVNMEENQVLSILGTPDRREQRNGGRTALLYDLFPEKGNDNDMTVILMPSPSGKLRFEQLRLAF